MTFNENLNSVVEQKAKIDSIEDLYISFMREYGSRGKSIHSTAVFLGIPDDECGFLARRCGFSRTIKVRTVGLKEFVANKDVTDLFEEHWGKGSKSKDDEAKDSAPTSQTV